MSINKTIRSRSNKNLGDVLEEKWEITGKTVIAEPQPGDQPRGIAPRLGIYDYEVKPIVQQVPMKAVSEKRTPVERKRAEPNVGGTRREASTAPVVRRVN